MIGVLLAGVYYVYQKKTAQARHEQLPPLPPPPALGKEPSPILSPNEVEKIRLATKDADPQVRWAAIELLHRVRDPKAFEILETAMSIDTEQEVRHKALDILKESGKADVSSDLIKAMNDTEPEIRMAALTALGELGDPKTAPYIVKALMDVEPNIRMQALHTLGLIEAKQQAKHQQMQEELKRQYEEMLRQRNQKGSTQIQTADFFKKRIDVQGQDK
jgi:HEAT repeat protein